MFLRKQQDYRTSLIWSSSAIARGKFIGRARFILIFSVGGACHTVQCLIISFLILLFLKIMNAGLSYPTVCQASLYTHPTWTGKNLSSMDSLKRPSSHHRLFFSTLCHLFCMVTLSSIVHALCGVYPRQGLLYMAYRYISECITYDKVCVIYQMAGKTVM